LLKECQPFLKLIHCTSVWSPYLRSDRKIKYGTLVGIVWIPVLYHSHSRLNTVPNSRASNTLKPPLELRRPHDVAHSFAGYYQAEEQNRVSVPMVMLNQDESSKLGTLIFQSFLPAAFQQLDLIPSLK
jgi:hypothetical protein